MNEKDKRLRTSAMLEIHGNMPVNYVFPRGLKEDGVYVDEKTGIRYYGAALMSAGIPLPAEAGEYLSYQMVSFHIHRIFRHIYRLKAHEYTHLRLQK